MKRAPFGGGDEIEIRQVFAAEDFGEALTPELREQEERLRVRRPGRSDVCLLRHSGASRSDEPGIHRDDRIPGSRLRARNDGN